jgi:hypothetical protein
MTIIEIIGLLALVGGIALVFGGLTGSKLGMKKKIPKAGGLVAGGLLIIVSLWGFGTIAWFEGIDTTTADTSTDGMYPNWDVTPSVALSEGTLNSAETKFTIGAIANTTAHTITETDNTTWVNPKLQFVCTPEIPDGFTPTADDLATLYYEVTNPEITTDDGTDTYKLFTKSGGNRQLIWTGDGTHYVSSHSTLLYTGNVTLSLTLTCNQDSFSRMENTYDPVTVYIKFYNKDSSWSKTYEADFMLISTYT